MVMNTWDNSTGGGSYIPMQWNAGESYQIVLEYSRRGGQQVSLQWSLIGSSGIADAIEAVKSADVAIFFLGENGAQSGEVADKSKREEKEEGDGRERRAGMERREGKERRWRDREDKERNGRGGKRREGKGRGKRRKGREGSGRKRKGTRREAEEKRRAEEGKKAFSTYSFLIVESRSIELLSSWPSGELP